MRFEPGKAWPHPVLRPPNMGDDYPHAEFEVEIEVQRTKGSTALQVTATFELSDPDLLKLVERGAADYVLLIRASKTHYRKPIRSADAHMDVSIPAGTLSGRVELSPFLVLVEELKAFCADGWHPDFAGRAFDIAAGSVLAEDQPKTYWVDTADEAPLGSIFTHVPRRDLADGRWECQLDGERVAIAMSQADSQRYLAARAQANHKPEGQYLMNGIYLPALLHVLINADQEVDTYCGRRWFASLDQRLEAVGCKRLGSKGVDRLVDAQKVLESPFSKMPLVAYAGDS